MHLVVRGTLYYLSEDCDCYRFVLDYHMGNLLDAVRRVNINACEFAEQIPTSKSSHVGRRVLLDRRYPCERSQILNLIGLFLCLVLRFGNYIRLFTFALNVGFALTLLLDLCLQNGFEIGIIAFLLMEHIQLALDFLHEQQMVVIELIESPLCISVVSQFTEVQVRPRESFCIHQILGKGYVSTNLHFSLSIASHL